MTQYAKLTVKSAPLSGEFGEQMARRYFGDEAVEEMPRYVRGEKKGKLKGRIGWKKVVEGGWVRTGPSGDWGHSGRVERRVNKVIAAVLYVPQWRERPEILEKWELDFGDGITDEDMAWI